MIFPDIPLLSFEMVLAVKWHIHLLWGKLHCLYQDFFGGKICPKHITNWDNINKHLDKNKTWVEYLEGDFNILPDFLIDEIMM